MSQKTGEPNITFKVLPTYKASPLTPFLIFLNFCFSVKNYVRRFLSKASWTRISILSSTDALLKSEDTLYETKIISVNIYFQVM